MMSLAVGQGLVKKVTFGSKFHKILVKMSQNIWTQNQTQKVVTKLGLLDIVFGLSFV